MVNTLKVKREKVSYSKKYRYKDWKYQVGCAAIKDDKSFYINISSWVKPDEDLPTDLRAFNRRFKIFMNMISDVYFEGLKWSLMRVTDAPTENVTMLNQKYSFMGVELTYHFDCSMEFKSDHRQFQLQKMTENIIQWIEQYDKGLSIVPNKIILK